MFRWLRRREGKRIATEVSEPPENRRAEPPNQIAELLRIVGEDRSAPPAKFPGAKKAQPTRRHPGRRLIRLKD